jgi:hypothetical protein
MTPHEIVAVLLETAETLGGSLRLAVPQRAALTKFGVSDSALSLALNIARDEGLVEVHGSGLSAVIYPTKPATDGRPGT